MYPPLYRSLGTIAVGVSFGLAAVAGVVVALNWAQRIACLVVALIAFGLVALEWRKPMRPRGRR